MHGLDTFNVPHGLRIIYISKLFLPDAYLPKTNFTFVRFYSSFAFKALQELAFLT